MSKLSYTYRNIRYLSMARIKIFLIFAKGKEMILMCHWNFYETHEEKMSFISADISSDMAVILQTFTINIRAFHHKTVLRCSSSTSIW